MSIDIKGTISSPDFLRDLQERAGIHLHPGTSILLCNILIGEVLILLEERLSGAGPVDRGNMVADSIQKEGKP